MCNQLSFVNLFSGKKLLDFFLRVTIPFAFEIENEEKNEPVNEPVNDTVKLVLETISKSPKLSKEQIAVQIGKSRATVTRALATLVRLDKIRRVGSDKNGHWEVINNQSDK